jgi:hypothetical protein
MQTNVGKPRVLILNYCTLRYIYSTVTDLVQT